MHSLSLLHIGVTKCVYCSYYVHENTTHNASSNRPGYDVTAIESSPIFCIINAVMTIHS